MIRGPKASAQKASVQQLPELKLLRLGMAVDDNVDELTARRDQFLDELRALEYTIRKNNKRASESFNNQESVTIANFFFEVMGPNALNRLRSLVQYYMQVDTETGLDRGSSARAEQLSKNKPASIHLRRFFLAFRKATATETGSATMLSSLYKLVESLKLLAVYNALSDEARNKQSALRPWLLQRHYQPATGEVWQSVVVRYLSKALRVVRKTLQKVCQTALI